MSTQVNSQARKFQIEQDADAFFPNNLRFRRRGSFVAMRVRENSETATTGDSFSTDTAKGAGSPLIIRTNPWFVKYGFITSIAYRLNAVTAGRTFQLWITEGDYSTAYTDEMKILYESASGRVDDTAYNYTGENKRFILDTVGEFRGRLDWSSTTGGCIGGIVIRGDWFL